MSLFDIVKSKKIKIIYLALLVIIIFSLLERAHKDKDEVVQAFNYFLENKNFTSVKFELYTNGPILDAIRWCSRTSDWRSEVRNGRSSPFRRYH